MDQGFAANEQIWNADICNEKSLKVDSFAQGKTFTRYVKNPADDVPPVAAMAAQTYLQY